MRLLLRCIAAFSLGLILILTGCSMSHASKPSIRQVKSALEKAGKQSDSKAKIYYLHLAYEQTRKMEKATPPPEKLDVFLQQYGAVLDGIPREVYGLSMQTEEFEAFEWALENGAKVDVHYNELLKFWELGSAWRDCILSEHSETALPIFMDEAIKGYDRIFFRQHLAEFKASGFRLHRLMVPTEFNSRLCRFIADEAERAMKKGNNEQVLFWVDNMPSLPSVVYIDEKTKQVMRELGDYALQTLEDEAMFFKLVELGYDLNRIDLDNPVIGSKLIAALRANPEYAVRVLALDEWRGVMAEVNFDFIKTLPDDALDALTWLYLDEAIEFSMKHNDGEGALRFIQLRAKKKPYDQGAYMKLTNRSLKHESKEGFNYVLKHGENLDIFNLDLSALAESQDLFVQYAPKIMKKIYHTMDSHPKTDGTTFGRIYAAFTADNEQAGLYIVENYNLSKKWVEITKGRTLLMDVCRAGNLAAARYLIEKTGADVHAQTGYQELKINLFGRVRPTEGKLTPIFFAAQSGNTELIKYVAAQRFDSVNSRSNFGATPLMYAVSEGQLEAVKVLINLGARVNAQMNPNLNNGIGDFSEISNAYRRARADENQKVLAVLKQAGARP